MPAGRHRKAPRSRVRLQRWAAVGAPVLAAAAIVPVASALQHVTSQGSPSATDHPPAAHVERAAARTVSRDLVRPEPPPPHLADVEQLAEQTPTSQPPDPADLKPRWVTAELNVWSDADEDSRLLTVLDAGGKVQVTGVVHGSWAQVARGDRLAWVHKAYLSQTKPVAATAIRFSGAVSGVACSDGSSVESGLVPHTIEVYRAVCAAFPAVTSWGGLSGSGGDHGSGHALDIMCTGSLGDAIAAYVRAHASELGVSYVIWSQHIWSVERGSEGWRAMEDRGSTTANHYDHVHVSLY